MPPTGRDTEGSVAFLMKVAELLHSYGTPAFRLERVLLKVASDLGIEASFLSTPTAVIASVGEAPRRVVHLIRSDSGEVDLGKLVEFDETMDRVRDRELTPREGLERLEAIAGRGSRYPAAVGALAFAAASAGAAVFFHGGPLEVLATLLLSLVTYLLARLSPGGHDAVGLFEPLAAFTTASLAAAGAFWFGIDARIVTLAGLIVLVPGLTLTVGFIELATRHLVSGMARLAGAGAVFLTLLFGVALGWRVVALIAGFEGGIATAFLPPRTTSELTAGWVWAAVLTAPFAFAIVLEARRSEFGVIFLASVLGYLAARFGADRLGGDLGPFLGALVVGLVANAYARLADRPALVPLTPGIFMLVPGSLGFRSLTSFLDADAAAGTEWAFRTGLVAVSLVGGLLLSNLILPPRRVL
ncbi:MAG TPA: threonine/serine exporter family protein [Planctomycetes bacterium]|nr:threonine/serine exporter family protein [Planctomycetota bacterium]